MDILCGKTAHVISIGRHYMKKNSYSDRIMHA